MQSSMRLVLTQQIRQGLRLCRLMYANTCLCACTGDVHVWDIGGYWALPMQWIQNALAINEFSAGAQPPTPSAFRSAS